MAKVVTIPWNEGMGSITATYEGSGNGPITLTSEANTGIDRAQEITVTTDNGLASEKVLVSQEGLRQPFGLSGGGVFRLANGGRFGVLKGVEKALVYISNSTLISNGTLLRNF